MSTDPSRADVERKRRGEVDRKVAPKTLAALLVAAVLIAFAVVNSQTVQVDFVLFQSDTPLVIALVIAMLLGFVLGSLTRWRSRRRRR